MQSWHRPDSMGDALTLLARAPVTVAAGCTDLLPATPMPGLSGDVLDITGIAALRGVTKTESGVRIGAATRWRDVMAADLPPAFDALKAAAREVGAIQIQNAGTVGGNLCNASPAADGVPPLMVLDAEVELQSLGGTRRLPLDEFLIGVRRTALGPGELLTAVHVPAAATTGHSAFRKLGARRHLVISIAMVAARFDLAVGRVRQAAVSVGACSAVAVRLTALETALTGCTVAEAGAVLERLELGETLAPITDLRADAAYRETAAAEMVRRVSLSILEAAG